MTEEQIQILVRQIVAEILAAPTPEPEPRALVLFSGALLGFEDALAAIDRLHSTGLCLDYIQTESAERILDQDAICRIGMRPASASLVGNHDLLIVATLTANLAAKVANGIADCLGSNVMAEFIMSNKKVVAAATAACPDNADKATWFPEMPEAYKEMLRGNLARLDSFGVRLSSAAHLDDAVIATMGEGGKGPGAVQLCAEKVIGEQLVRGLEPGSTLRIAPDAVVTSLAFDTARTLGITLARN